MAYIFKQKLRLEELVNFDAKKHKVLIYEPEEYLGALYSYYLKQNNFEVNHSYNLIDLKENIISFVPDIFVFNIEAIDSLALYSAGFPGLKLIATGRNLNNEKIKELMELGVLGHINCSLHGPKDIAVIVRGILS